MSYYSPFDPPRDITSWESEGRAPYRPPLRRRIRNALVWLWEDWARPGGLAILWIAAVLLPVFLIFGGLFR